MTADPEYRIQHLPVPYTGVFPFHSEVRVIVRGMVAIQYHTFGALQRARYTMVMHQCPLPPPPLGCACASAQVPRIIQSRPKSKGQVLPRPPEPPPIRSGNIRRGCTRCYSPGGKGEGAGVPFPLNHCSCRSPQQPTAVSGSSTSLITTRPSRQTQSRHSTSPHTHRRHSRPPPPHHTQQTQPSPHTQQTQQTTSAPMRTATTTRTHSDAPATPPTSKVGGPNPTHTPYAGQDSGQRAAGSGQRQLEHTGHHPLTQARC
jgi:hypothetical protein